MYLVYLNGDPLADAHLRRADTHKAKTCIVLTNKNSKDAYATDHSNILMGLAVKKYVYNAKRDSKDNNMRLCMQLIKPESRKHYYSSLNIPSNDQLIIVEEIKMNLLAKSCFAPGLIAMISNLISSSSFEQQNFEEEWLRDYTQGMGHEIYRVPLSEEFEGYSFEEIARIVYWETKSIIFALEFEFHGKPVIRLNPSKTRLLDNRYLLTTARHLQSP